MRSLTAVCVAISGVLGAPSAARADETNRYLFPIGERESLRANAGIAGSSPGSVFYNPAGLARLEHPSLSVSGTTLMYFRSSTERFIELDEPIPYEATGFAPIPSSLVSTYKVGGFGLATAILVPDLFQLDNRQKRETANFRLNLLQSIRRQDLWIGAGIARAFGDKVAVGLSVFGVRRSTVATTFFQLTVPADPTVISQSTGSQTDSIIGVHSVLGVSIDPAPWLTIGLRIEPPFLQLAASANIYQSTLSADATGTELTEVDKDGVEINQPLPADFGIGFAIRPSPAATIYVDASVQLGQNYTAVDDPDIGPPEEVDLDAAPRFNLGMDFQATPTLAFHAGLLYNRSAAGRLSEGGDAVEHFYGGSLGVSWVKKSVRTGVGIFALRSSGTIVPILAMPGDTEPTKTTALGGLLSVAYLL
jgi:hypothetical protein